jgi:hypothetical protein
MNFDDVLRRVCICFIKLHVQLVMLIEE